MHRGQVLRDFQNKSVTTNFMLIKIDGIKRNSNCQICKKREVMTHFFSKCIKKAAEIYVNEVGEVIHLEFCEQVGFDDIPETVFEN